MPVEVCAGDPFVSHVQASGVFFHWVCHPYCVVQFWLWPLRLLLCPSRKCSRCFFAVCGGQHSVFLLVLTLKPHICKSTDGNSIHSKLTSINLSTAAALYQPPYSASMISFLPWTASYKHFLLLSKTNTIYCQKMYKMYSRFVPASMISILAWTSPHNLLLLSSTDSTGKLIQNTM